MALLKRLGAWGLQWLIVIDQAAILVIQIVTFVLLGHGWPNADETISSHVGRSSLMGKRWAMACEWAINLLFFWQKDETGARNHCRRVIEWAEAPEKFRNKHPELAPNAACMLNRKDQ